MARGLGRPLLRPPCESLGREPPSVPPRVLTLHFLTTSLHSLLLPPSLRGAPRCQGLSLHRVNPCHALLANPSEGKPPPQALRGCCILSVRPQRVNRCGEQGVRVELRALGEPFSNRVKLNLVPRLPSFLHSRTTSLHPPLLLPHIEVRRGAKGSLAVYLPAHPTAAALFRFCFREVCDSSASVGQCAAQREASASPQNRNVPRVLGVKAPLPRALANSAHAS